MEPPRLLVLRIWSATGRFRALVRELDPERQQRFDDPRALLAFLLEPPAAPSEPGRQPASES